MRTDRVTGLLKTLVSLAFVAMLQPITASACAVCYGDPDSPAAQGLTWAIVALGVIVVGVLGAIVAFFVQVSRKAALMPPEPAPATLAVGRAS
jgi:hypothetical protein